MTTRKPTIFIVHPSDILTDHLLYGDGLIACGFLRELASRGYRLHVACQEVDLREPMPPNVIFHPIKQSWPGPLKRLEYMVRTRLLLEKLRKEETIDVVHQMNPVFVGLSLGMIGCGLPVLLGTYVARWPDQNRGSLKVRLESALRWAICLVQQWQATKLMLTAPAAINRIAAPGMVKDKIVNMSHGIDAELFSPSGQPPVHGPHSILFYTSVARRKGIFDLLRAFDIIARKVPDATLSIIGRGDHWDEVNAEIATMECRDRIRTTGQVPRESSVQFFRDHAVYVLPSHGEPFATTVIEGMACGRPLVVTETGGLPHLLPPNGEGGFIVPQENPQALAEALLKLLDSPEMQARMGAANRDYVEKNYTWERVVDRLEEVYAGLMTERPSGARVALAS